MGREGVDGDEIGGDNGELVPDQRDLEGVVDRGVDDAEEVALVGLEGHAGVGAAWARGVDVGAVEEDVVTWWGGRAGWDQGVLDFVSRAVVPVCDGEDAEVFVVVERGWAVDLDGSYDAVCVLT